MHAWINMRKLNMFKFQCAMKRFLLDTGLKSSRSFYLTVSWSMCSPTLGWRYHRQQSTSSGIMQLLLVSHTQVWIQGTECLWGFTVMPLNLWPNIELRKWSVSFWISLSSDHGRSDTADFWCGPATVRSSTRTEPSIQYWGGWFGHSTFCMKGFTHLLALVANHWLLNPNMTVLDHGWHPNSISSKLWSFVGIGNSTNNCGNSRAVGKAVSMLGFVSNVRPCSGVTILACTTGTWMTMTAGGL